MMGLSHLRPYLDHHRLHCTRMSASFAMGNKKLNEGLMDAKPLSNEEPCMHAKSIHERCSC